MKPNAGVRWVIAAAVLWSSGGLFIKLAPASGLAVAFGRAVVTSLFYLVVLRPNLRQARWSSAAVYAGMIISFVSATKLTTAANAIFLQYTGPAYVIALGPWLLRERFRKLDALCVAASLAGISLFFVGHPPSMAQRLGDVLGIVSGVFFAAVVLSMRRDATQGGTLPSVALGNLLAAIGLLPFVWREVPALVAPPALGLFLYLGVVQMGVAYLCFGRGLKTVPAAAASLMTMLEPILNPLWVFLGTGERPSGWALLGGAVVIGAVAVRTWAGERELVTPVRTAA